MKAPRLIHCTFTSAHIEAMDPANVHVEVEGSANQCNVNMIIWPAQLAELKKLIEQMESGRYRSEAVEIKWVPLFSREE